MDNDHNLIPFTRSHSLPNLSEKENILNDEPQTKLIKVTRKPIMIKSIIDNNEIISPIPIKDFSTLEEKEVNNSDSANSQQERQEAEINSNKEQHIESDNVHIYKDNNTNNNDDKHSMVNVFCKWIHTTKGKIIFYTSLSLLISGIILGIIFGVLSMRKTPELESKLIVKLNRELNEVSRYSKTKNSLLSLDMAGNINQIKETTNTDFILNIYNITTTNDNDLLYHAYFVVIEMYKSNQTNENISTSTEEKEYVGGIDIFQASLAEESMPNTTDNDDNISFTIEDDLTGLSNEEINEIYTQGKALPIFKVSFYENGTIVDMYHSKGLSEMMITELNENIYKTIPLLSKDLYTQANATQRYLNEDDNSNTFVSTINDTTLYNNENHGVSQGDLHFANSNLNSQTETNIDNINGVINNISSSGSVSFIQDENDTSFNEPHLTPDNPLYGIPNNSTDNIIKTEFNSISSNTNSFIAFINKTINTTITKRLNVLTSSITFVKYNASETNDNDNDNESERRLLEMFNFPNAKPFHRKLSTIPHVTSGHELKRLLTVDTFAQPILFSHSLFKLNIVGLKINVYVVTESNPNTGELIINVVMNFGNHEISILETTEQTNLHWALQMSGKILDNTVSEIDVLLSKLKTYKTKWFNSIIKQANYLNTLLSNVFDIGSLYQEPMNTLYQSIQTFAKGKFNNLKSVITKEHTKLNTLKSNISKSSNSYEQIVQMINEVMIQYKEYINLMKDNIDIFHIHNYEFINNVNNALMHLREFTVDVLYDLMDQIENAKNVYNTFSTLLFNSVDKGLNVFKSEMYSTLLSIINEPLTIVEFIGNAMQTNHIMKSVLPEDQRKYMTDITFSFKERIFELIEIIYNYISSSQSSSNELTLLKNNITKDVKSKLNSFNIDTNNMLELVKSKINLIHEYESYVGNIDALDSIENYVFETTLTSYIRIFISANDNNILYNKVFPSQSVNDISTLLSTKSKQIISELSYESKEAFEYMAMLFDFYKEKYYYELRDLSERIISFYRENVVHLYNSFYSYLSQLEKELKSIITQNYNYGEEYINDVYSIYNSRKGQGWYRIGRTGDYEELCMRYTVLNMELIQCLAENLFTLLQDEYMSLAASVKQILRTYLTLPFIDEYSELTYIKQFISYIYTLDTNVDEVFNEEIFERDFNLPIMDLVQRVSDYYTLETNTFNSFKKSKIDHLSICYDVGDFYYQEKKSHTLHSPSYHDHSDYSSKRGNINKVQHSINSNQFDTAMDNILSNFTSYIIPHLTSFNNITHTIYNSIINDMRDKYTEFPTLQTYINEFEHAVTSDIISSILNNDLLHNAYNNITNGLNDKIYDLFYDIELQLGLIDSVYYKSFLKGSIHKFITEPNEIMFKLNQYMQSQSTKGEMLINDIEQLLTFNFDNVVAYSFNVVKDIINISINDIYNCFPQYPLNELQTLRKEYFDNKVNTITNGFNSNQNTFYNKSVQCSLLDVSCDDFFVIHKYINTYNITVINTLQYYINNIHSLIDSYRYIYEHGIEYDEYNFQIVKLRKAIYYYNALSDLSQRILSTEHLLNNNAELQMQYTQIAKAGVSYIIKDTQMYLSNELNNKTMNEISPFISTVLTNIKYIFEQLINDKIIFDKLTAYTNYLYNINSSYRNQIDHIVNTFTSSITTLLNNEINILFQLKEIKQLNMPYYINTTSLHKSYNVIVNGVIDGFYMLRQQIDKYEIDSNVLSESIKYFHEQVNTGVSNIKEGVNTFSIKYPTFNTLNITYSFNDLVNQALNTSYIDSIKNDISFNASNIMRSKYRPLFLANLTTIVDTIQPLVLNVVNSKYDEFLAIVTENSTLPSEHTFNISEFSVEFISKSNEYLNSYNTSLFNVFNYTSISEMFRNNYQLAFNMLKVNDVDNAYLQQQLHECFDVLYRVCEDRSHIEVIELEEHLKESIISIYEQTLNEFMNVYGELYSKKVKYYLTTHGVNVSIRNIIEKLIILNNYISYLFTNTKSIGESTKTAYENVLMTYLNDIEMNIINNVNSTINAFITNITHALPNDIAHAFTDMLLDSSNSNQIQYAFSDNVYNVFRNVFSVQFNNTLVNAFNMLSNSLCFDILQDTIINDVNTQLSLLQQTVLLKQNEISGILSSKSVEATPNILNTIVTYITEYKATLNSHINTFTFVINETPLQYLSSFINTHILPIPTTITEYYNNIEDDILSMISNEIDNFDDYMSLVLNKTPTEDIVTKANETNINIESTINEISDYILTELTAIEQKIHSKVNTTTTLRRNSIILFPNTAETESSPLNIKQLKQSISSITEYLSSFANEINEHNAISTLLGKYYIFKRTITNGITQITNPLTNILIKLNSFLTPDKLNTFQSRVLSEINEIISISNNHLEQVTHIMDISIHSLQIKPQETFNQLRYECEYVLNTLIHNLVDAVVKQVQPSERSVDKKFNEKFKWKIPLAISPFIFDGEFQFNVQYGFKFCYENMGLFVNVFANVNVNTNAKAGVSLMGIFKLLSGFDGQLGDGVVGVEPEYSLKTFTGKVHSYYKMKKYNFLLYIDMEYKKIKMEKKKIKVCRWFSFHIYIPKWVTKVKRLVEKGIKGVADEKHFIKEF